MPRYNCTFHGIHEWSSHMFEKLGWMLLAKRNKNRSSIRCFIKDLRHLLHEIDAKCLETMDPDRKKDLQELHSNVSYLAEHATTLLR